MKKLILGLFILIMVNVQAQYSIFGGYSMLYGFNASKAFSGLHIGGEFPKSDAVSFYGKFAFYPGQRSSRTNLATIVAKDVMTNPYVMDINYRDKLNYFTIDGGTRYYVIGTYDSGFSLYGGTNLILAVSQVKLIYDNFDRNLYTIPDEADYPDKGSIISFGFGLQGGMKNTFPGVGTVYADLFMNYFILAQGNNNTAKTTTMFSPLLIGFNLGFRKDFY